MKKKLKKKHEQNKGQPLLREKNAVQIEKLIFCSYPYRIRVMRGSLQIDVGTTYHDYIKVSDALRDTELQQSPHLFQCANITHLHIDMGSNCCLAPRRQNL